MGGCPGLGGEDGRANGGAVSLSGAANCSQTSIRVVVELVLVMTFSLAACSRQSASPSLDPTSLLQSIAPADASKYPSLREAKHWSNPYLVIRADRVGCSPVSPPMKNRS